MNKYIIFIGDGIYDQLSNQEIIEAIWQTTSEETRANSIHFQCAIAVDMIIKSAMIRKTFDNVTFVIIAFNGLNSIFETNPLEKSTPMKAESNSDQQSNNKVNNAQSLNKLEEAKTNIIEGKDSEIIFNSQQPEDLAKNLYCSFSPADGKLNYNNYNNTYKNNLHCKKSNEETGDNQINNYIKDKKENKQSDLVIVKSRSNDNSHIDIVKKPVIMSTKNYNNINLNRNFHVDLLNNQSNKPNSKPNTLNPQKTHNNIAFYNKINTPNYDVDKTSNYYQKLNENDFSNSIKKFKFVNSVKNSQRIKDINVGFKNKIIKTKETNNNN